MTNKQDVLNMLSCNVSGQSFTYTGDTGMTAGGTANYYSDGCGGNSLWGYWQNCYYPYVIRESYPIYIQERAMDKGKQAFELLKVLMDKKLLKVEKVSDFIEAMDAILKTL